VNFFAIDSLYRTVFTNESPGKGMGWKPYQRFHWFWGQRAYPTGQIPVGLRWQEWEAKKQAEGDRGTLDDPAWQQIGPMNFAGRLLCIAIVPGSPNTMYVGAASGGIWKTTDGGANWTALGDNLPSLAVGAIAIPPSNPSIIYIGSGEGSFNIDAVYGAGVLKSTDAGVTWNTTGLNWTLSQYRAVNKIVIDPANPNIIYAATSRNGSYGGIYKSTNGGTSWGNYLTGLDIKDLIMHPDSNQVLYCVAGYPFGTADNGVYKSTNGGTAWTKLTNGLPASNTQGRQALAISTSSPTTVYVGISKTISSGAGLLGVYRTTNGGASWSLRASSPNFYGGQGWYNNVLAVHPTNSNTVYAAGIDLYKSTDGGTSWSQLTYWSYSPGNSQYVHADHHAFAFHPSDFNKVFAGTDGGLFRSTDAGTSWSALNNGLVTFQFYAMGNSLQRPSECYGGTQDNGTDKYTGSPTWTEVMGGDGGYCVVDYVYPDIVYAETQMGSHYRSTNSGASWSAIQSGISDYGAWVTPVVMDPANRQTLYTATSKVYRTTNSGTNWSAISADLYFYISTLAVAPSSPSTIYAGCEGNGKVFKTTDTGGSWSDISAGLPDRYVTRVAVHPTNANTVFVSVSGYGSGHVYKSTSGGSSWANSSTGLPDQPVNVIVIDGNNPNTLYAGTDLGVYRSTDAGASWSSFSTGLPNVVVDDLALHPTGGTLRAATHGRGMWEVATGGSSILITSPSGGEVWGVGVASAITWSSGGVTGDVRIELNRDYPGGPWETLFASTPNDGSQSWTPTSPTTTKARIRITSISDPTVYDESNTDFSIVTRQITILSPIGGETWVYGTTQTISWSRVGASTLVVIQLNRTYPSGTWVTLATTSALSFSWSVTSPATSNARIRVYFSSYPSDGDTCDASFTISSPELTITSPDGGEVWTPGELRPICWIRQSLTSTVKVELNRNYPSGTWELLGTNITGDSLVRTVNGPGSANVRVRVTSITYPEVTDVSNVNFTILNPSLVLSTPNGGEVWPPGTVQDISWQSINIFGAFNLYLNRAYPIGEWNLICVNDTNSPFEWTVTEPLTDSARVKVVSAAQGTLYDESNANFRIGQVTQSVTVTSPNGGETWITGTQATISWTRQDASGNATVSLNRNYPTGSWENLTTTASGNSFTWTVSGSVTNAARVKVFLTSNPTISDISNANFSIATPSLTLTYPVGGETLAVGSSVTIAWTRNYVSGNVTVALNRNYPTGAWENLTTTASGSTFAWTVSGLTTSTARMKVFLTSDPTISDLSDANFSIALPSLTLTYPVGAETLAVGSAATITWTRFAASGNVTVALNRNYPSGAWENLTTSASGNSLAWTVSGNETDKARIQVYLTASPTVADTCNSDFRIWIPALALSSPNGGETWILGRTDTVSWSRHAASGNVTVRLCRNYPSGTWEILTTTASGNSFGYLVTGTTGNANRVRIFLTANSNVADTSNANFTIAAPSLTITAPTGAETWIVDSTRTIRWSRYYADGNVTVQLNRNYPSGPWENLSTTAAGDSLAWAVSEPTSAHARVRNFLNSNPTIGDTCNADLQIIDPGITLLSPLGGEIWALTDTVTIRWTRRDVTAVNVRLNRDYPSGSWEALATNLVADSLSWIVSGLPSSACRVKVESSVNSAVSAVSPASFSILYPSLQLSAPIPGDTLAIGNTGLIKWQRNAAVPGTVRVEICRDYPSGAWTMLTETTADSLVWLVSEPATSNARFRVKSLSLPWIGDTTDANIPIVYPELALLSPESLAIWEVGRGTTIRWQRAHLLPGVNVDLKRNWPSGNWETLASHVLADSLVWTISGPTATNARLRIRSDYNSYAEAVSDCLRIIWPQLVLSQPNGGEVFGLGNSEEIRWERTDYDGPIALYLNANYPTGAWTPLAQGLLGESFTWLVQVDTTHAARIKIVSADGFLADTSGSFSIVAPRLEIIQPNGGEALSISYPYSIQWSRLAASGAVRIEVNRNWPSSTWEMLTDTVTSNSFNWFVPPPENSSNRIRLSRVSRPEIGDTSSANFSITVAGLWVTTPNGGDTLVVDQSTVLRWRRVNISGPVSVTLNRNYPDGAWETIAGSVSADSLVWTVTGTPTLAARVRVTLLSNPMFTDVSDDNVGIYNPALILKNPVAGDTLLVGSQCEISWTRIGVTGKVHVYVKRNWPSGGWEAIAYNQYGDSYLWIVTSPTASAARIRVLSGVNSSWGDTTDGGVAIVQPSLVLNAPAGGEVWPLGAAATIRWTRTNAPGQVDVFLSRNATSGPWESIGSSFSDSLVWGIAGDTTSRARIKISHHDVPSLVVTSAANHAILTPQLTLISPQGNETYGIGRQMQIRWTRQAVSGAIEVLFDRSGTLDDFETLATVVGADSFAWLATGPETQTAAVQVRATSGPPAHATSPPTIHIVQPALALTHPADSSVLVVGEVCTLRWTRLLVDGAVRVELNRTYPSGPWEMLAQVTGDSLLWTVTGPTSVNAAFRIRSLLYPEMQDEVEELHIISPSLTLVSPNGGEVWGIGNRKVISWQRQDYDEPVRIYLNSSYPAGGWTQLASAVLGDSFEWTVSGVPTLHARIKIVASDYGIGDSSQADFSIVYPQLTLTSPASGETLIVGEPLSVQWSRLEASGMVRVELARDFPNGNWENLASSIEGDSTTWIVTGSGGEHNRIRIFLENRPEIGDTLHGDFVIGEPSIEVMTPVDGDTFFVGSACNVSWERHFASGPVSIELHRNGQWEPIVSGITQNDFTWTITGESVNEARVRIQLESNPAVTDESGNFAILNPVLSLSEPQGGDSLVVGETCLIRWSRLGYAGGVNVELAREWPGAWETIATDAFGDSLAWVVVGPRANDARMRIMAASNPDIADTTDGGLRILAPSLALLYPAGGELCAIGEERAIRWQRTDAAGQVEVFLSRDGIGGSWETLGTSLNDSLIWIVAGEPTTHGRIKIVEHVYSMADTSETDFSIVYPQLTLTSPLPGDTLIAGESVWISWSRFVAPGPVSVELNRNFPSGTWEVIASGIEADSVLWIVSGSEGDHNRIRIFLEGRSEIGDTLGGDIVLGEPQITVATPVAGDTFFVGGVCSITWQRHFAPGLVAIDLYRNNQWEPIASGILEDSLSWAVQGEPAGGARVRVKLESNPAVADESDDFAILNRVLSLSEPQSGDTLVVGETCLIRWSRLGYAGGVNIELAREWPGTWEPIATNVLGDSLAWAVTGPRASNARMRIVAASNPELGDTTGGGFWILEPALSLIHPVGGEVWALGQTQTIRWLRTDASNEVEVSLSRDGSDDPWETIGMSSGDSLIWTVTGDTTSWARVKISLSDKPDVEAITAEDFTIGYSVLDIVAPQPNRLCFVGDEVLVRWERAVADGPVRVMLVRPGLPDEVFGEGLLGDSLRWHVGAPEAEISLIRVIHEQNPLLRDSVQILGPIVPRIQFESLGQDSAWVVGSSRVLRWNRHYVAGLVLLEMMRGYPNGVWEEIAPALDGDSAEVVAELPEDDHVRFRIVSVENPTIGDTTHEDLRIVQPSLTLMSPSPGARAKIGEPLTVHWSRHGLAGVVEVFLNRNYPSGAWESIGESSGDSLIWVVEGDATEHVRLCVSNAEYSSAGDTLDGDMEFYRTHLEITTSTPSDTIFIHQTIHFEILRADFPDAVDIDLRRAPSADWETITSGLAGNEYDWIVAGPEGMGALVRVKASEAAEPCDTLDEMLTILEPSLILTHPAPDETLTVGETVMISWRRAGISEGVRVELVRGEEGREMITDAVLADSIFWQVTGSRTLLARFCIRSNEFPQYGDSSSAPFAILSPSLELTEPAQDGVDTMDCARPISWRWVDGEGTVRVEMDRHYPSGEWELLVATEETSYVYIPSGAESDSVRYRVIAENNSSLGDTSGLRRLIAPGLTLNTTGGGIWYIGEAHAISWVRRHLAGQVRVDISRDEAGEEWDSLTTAEGDTVVWIVTAPETDFARFRVTSLADARYADTADASIPIKAPRLSLIEPNGGEDFSIGSNVNLRWVGEGFSGEVGIYLWRGCPAYHLDTLFASTRNDSIESWIVEREEADSCYIIIISLMNPALGDTSDDVFSIRGLSAGKDVVPYKFALEGNWPNPFNSTTTIRYSVAERVRIEMKIYNILGQEVAKLEDDWREPGVYTVSWQPMNVASGMYIVSMRAGGFVRQHRMMLVK
jgi:photosystem II stability/assembly factor-like uncharacterized protein